MSHLGESPYLRPKIGMLYQHEAGMQQRQEIRQKGKNEEKTDRSKGRNHPLQPSQLMRVWGKENKRKKQGVDRTEGPPF